MNIINLEQWKNDNPERVAALLEPAAKRASIMNNWKTRKKVAEETAKREKRKEYNDSIIQAYKCGTKNK